MNRIDITNKNFINYEPRGFIKKYWVKSDKKFLIKLNNELYPDQDIMEVLASNIHKILEMPTVNAYLIHDQNHNNGCMIESFLEEGEFLIELDSNIKFDFTDNVNYNISKCAFHVFAKLNSLINASEEDLEKMKCDYYKMIFADCLLNNEDRKLRNVGVIINEIDRSFRLTPLYDNGLIFNTYPAKREPVACVANEEFEVREVMDYLFLYAKDAIIDIASKFLNSFEGILNEVKEISPHLNNPKKETYIINRLHQTKEYLLSKNIEFNKEKNI